MRKFPYEQLLKERLMLTGVSATAARTTAQGRLEDNLISLAKIGSYANKLWAGSKDRSFASNP
jgi:hypothetical protein